MTSSVIDLDDLDRALLRELSLEGDLSAGELGRRFGLSQPATWRRVKRLEEAGVLQGLRVETDRAALGFGAGSFTFLGAFLDCFFTTSSTSSSINSRWSAPGQSGRP